MISIRYATIAVALLSLTANAEDWPRFRGPSGAGVADAGSIPMTWSPKANIGWKTELPGPGASSPIIIGNKAFVTCYSGYGLSQEDPGDIEKLMRHLVCVDLKTGKKLWQKDVPAAGPEDAYTGAGVPAHGYASHTPVSDGKNVYAFFGKSGVHAYDMDGKKLWEAEVGKESDPTKWGSSSSPIVYKDTVIVTASAESQSVIGFDKNSGEELWRQEAEGLDAMWGTPNLVKVDGERTDLVMCVAKEIWGLDPESGKLRWYADALGGRHAYTSVIVDGKRVFAFNGADSGSVAIDAGGEGDVSETNTVWTGKRATARFASPVRHKDKIYVVAQNIVSQVDAETGKRLDQVRLKGVMRTSGRFGALDYPSPIVLGDNMFYLNSRGQMFVVSLGDKMKQLEVNRVTTEPEVFRGTPAISNGRMLLRSSAHLYCIADKGESVNPEDNALAAAERAPAAPAGGGQRGGRRQDPMELFNDIDADNDGKVSMKELEGNRLESILKPMDKDGDDAVSKEEFTAGLAARRRSGGGGGGGGNDPRPDRPQRPESAGK
jgi:outer membrane protein assembly factor BamB